MSFLNNKSPGFEKNELVEVELPGNLDEKGAIKAFRIFKNELSKASEIISTAATMTTMSVVQWTVFTFDQEDGSKLKFNFNLVSPDYPKNIILLVARKFILLIGLATTVASPIAWWLLEDWLNDFAYKVNLNPLIFVLSGLAVILTTFISISIQSLKISRINPAEALRME